jgi:hypothetical protein
MRSGALATRQDEYQKTSRLSPIPRFPPPSVPDSLRLKFLLGLNELGCDPMMRERSVIRAITFVRVSHPPRPEILPDGPPPA